MLSRSPDSALSTRAASTLKKNQYSSDWDGARDTHVLHSFKSFPPEEDSILGPSEDAAAPNLEAGADGIVAKKLGVWGLVIMTFFCVSGGPYGIEVNKNN